MDSESVPFSLYTSFHYYYYRVCVCALGSVVSVCERMCNVYLYLFCVYHIMLCLVILLSFNTKHTDAHTARRQVALHADTFYLLFTEGLKEIFCLHIVCDQTFFVSSVPRRKKSEMVNVLRLFLLLLRLSCRCQPPRYVANAIKWLLEPQGIIPSGVTSKRIIYMWEFAKRQRCRQWKILHVDFGCGGCSK